MGFFDYARAANKYKDNELMLETIKRLRSFDEYHCLRNSSLLIGKKAAEVLPKSVEQYIGWMTVCNGGLLFDTTLLSVTDLDKELDIEFSTLDEYNNEETYGEMELPEGYFIIGVHIRRGDYKTFEGGRYYFELEEYKQHMQALCEVYKDRKVCFAISTNEKIDATAFEGLEICKTTNTTAVHDLYMLIQCDRIIGPLSTFSRWASFYGGVPLCFISREDVIKSDKDFSVIKDFYHFANGTEIINLTDKQV